jgi:acetyl esterase/lipase
MACAAAVIAVASMLAACSDAGPASAPAQPTTTSIPATTLPPTTTTTAPPAARYRDPLFADVTVARDIEYGSAPGLDGNPEALLLDLYEPAGDTEVSRPAVVWVHGGGYSGGDKGSGPSSVLASLFAQLGYVTVSINYRLLVPGGCTGGGPQGVPPECTAAALEAIHDAQAAVRWLRANADAHGIDTERIGIGGESAGAITAVGVGVRADDPGLSGNPGPSSAVKGWVSISGGLPGGVFVDSSDAPGLLFSGTADPTVPYQWSVDTNAAMEAAGVPVHLETLQGAGHVPWTEYRDTFEAMSIDFFFDALGLASAAR